VVLIVLFMTAPRDFKNEWFNHVMLPLNLVSNFVDVVSYIRLFAVGTAGYAVASSFNKMILGGGIEGVVAGLVAALLLFLGHTLNILLSVMGVLVHGVRLNTLEFSSHIGMAWTGLPYRPFRRARAEETAPR
jgi:V/A-type H+-transporting ATPase subunit I